MKYKTSELTGALLDAAVAKAEGMSFEVVSHKVWGDGSGITKLFERSSVQNLEIDHQ